MSFNDIITKNASQEVCSIVDNYFTACNKVQNLYPVGTAMDIPAWAALILAACLVCGEGRQDDKHFTPNDIVNNSVPFKPSNLVDIILKKSPKESEKIKEAKEDENFNLKVGKSINVFPRYGSLTLSMKVIPSRFGEDWLFREKTTEIFTKRSYWAKRSRKTKNDGFDDHFLIDFCDTTRELYAAYFDHFEIEGVPQSYQAFTSFLSPKAKAQALGIFHNYLTSDVFSFVLVRLFKREERAILDGDLKLHPKFSEASKRIRVGSSESAHKFMDENGSHVIVEYELGDVIYQVFVFGQVTYNELKMTFALSYEESKGNFSSYSDNQSELLSIKDYFHPYFAVHVGQVKIASNSLGFENIRTKLKKKFFMFRFYESIFQILNNKEVSDEFKEIEGQVITGMRLKKITKALTPTPERYWLSIILDNILSLYYVTL